MSRKITVGNTESFYSFQDSECNDDCQRDLCKDKMIKFNVYAEKMSFEGEKRGGEGIVKFGSWHGKPVAFKLLPLDNFENVDSDSITNAVKTRAEFETAAKLSHPNILKVLHVFRYQEIVKIGKNLITENWTIIVMEKHLKNIQELAFEERIFLPSLLKDAIGQVLYTILHQNIIQLPCCWGKINFFSQN